MTVKTERLESRQRRKETKGSAIFLKKDSLISTTNMNKPSMCVETALIKTARSVIT